MINILPYVSHMAEDAAAFMLRYMVENDLGGCLDKQLLIIALIVGILQVSMWYD